MHTGIVRPCSLYDEGDGCTEHPGWRYELEPLTSLRFIAALPVFVYFAPLAQPFAHDHALGQAIIVRQRPATLRAKNSLESRASLRAWAASPN